MRSYNLYLTGPIYGWSRKRVPGINLFECSVSRHLHSFISLHVYRLYVLLSLLWRLPLTYIIVLDSQHLMLGLLAWRCCFQWYSIGLLSLLYLNFVPGCCQWIHAAATDLVEVWWLACLSWFVGNCSSYCILIFASHCNLEMRPCKPCFLTRLPNEYIMLPGGGGPWTSLHF